MSTLERKLFFYAVTAMTSTAAAVGGKDIRTLKNIALKGLTDTIESFMDKDSFRPANDTVRANKLRMCMSRIDKPLKKIQKRKRRLKAGKRR